MNFTKITENLNSNFQIQWLAQAIKAVTPSKYLDLIIKGNTNA